MERAEAKPLDPCHRKISSDSVHMERAEAKNPFSPSGQNGVDSVHMERAEAKCKACLTVFGKRRIQSTWNVPRQSNMVNTVILRFVPIQSTWNMPRQRVICALYGVKHHDSVHMERAEAKFAKCG